jgi:DNA uptake protein ComE-like DNA-binding protein
MKKVPVLFVSLSLALLASLTGCSSPGGGSTATSAAPMSSAASSAVPQVAPPAGGSATPTASASTSVQTVDPNTATDEELVAALRSAGVDNPERWTDEVKEYGPYTAENLEPTLTQELGKYDISQDQLNKILSALKVG